MNHKPSHNRIAVPALAALALLSSACVIGPKYQRPGAPTAPGFKEPPPAGWKEAQPADGAIRGKWWEIYQDPQLNALEEQVAISNQNVLAAEAQFREAKAAVRIARSGLYPTVSASPSITGSQAPGGVTATSISGARSVYTLPFDATYQVDLWGNIRRGVTASAATAQASAADLANIRLLFQAELAADYYQLHGSDGDQALLTDTVKSYEDYLKLTKDRYDSGVASMSDVAQAQTQLETTRAQLVDLGVQRAQLEHAIAILIGKPPSEFSIAPAPIKIVPPPVPVGVPSALLERRPDIAAAERQAASANEQIGIAMAAFYPDLTLSASGGFERTSFLNWITWPSRFWSVGPQLAETLFDAGKRHAQVNMTEAAYDNTVATYRQTVLTAFQQVEDNLAALRILAQEAEVQTRAVKAAQDSLTLSTAQYTGGIVNYLQVITSQAALLQNQRTDIDILTRRMVASVQLVEALGGGWNASQLPATKDLVAGK